MMGGVGLSNSILLGMVYVVFTFKQYATEISYVGDNLNSHVFKLNNDQMWKTWKHPSEAIKKARRNHMVCPSYQKVCKS